MFLRTVTSPVVGTLADVAVSRWRFAMWLLALRSLLLDEKVGAVGFGRTFGVGNRAGWEPFI